MSMHKQPLTTIEETGLIAHGFGRDIGRPSMAADIFRIGVAWAQMSTADQITNIKTQLEHGMPHDQKLNRRLTKLLAEMVAAQAPKTTGHCKLGDKCVCGGDLPRVREGCGEWAKAPDLAMKTMSIQAAPGTAIKFGDVNGTPYQQMRAREHLNTATVYHVKSIEVGSTCSFVTLKEFPDMEFNTVMFHEVDA